MEGISHSIKHESDQPCSLTGIAWADSSGGRWLTSNATIIWNQLRKVEITNIEFNEVRDSTVLAIWIQYSYSTVNTAITW